MHTVALTYQPEFTVIRDASCRRLSPPPGLQYQTFCTDESPKQFLLRFRLPYFYANLDELRRPIFSKSGEVRTLQTPRQ